MAQTQHLQQLHVRSSNETQYLYLTRPLLTHTLQRRCLHCLGNTAAGGFVCLPEKYRQRVDRIRLRIATDKAHVIPALAATALHAVPPPVCITWASVCYVATFRHGVRGQLPTFARWSRRGIASTSPVSLFANFLEPPPSSTFPDRLDALLRRRLRTHL